MADSHHSDLADLCDTVAAAQRLRMRSDKNWSWRQTQSPRPLTGWVHLADGRRGPGAGVHP